MGCSPPGWSREGLYVAYWLEVGVYGLAAGGLRGDVIGSCRVGVVGLGFALSVPLSRLSVEPNLDGLLELCEGLFATGRSMVSTLAEADTKVGVEIC
jgi:hypothetical protein